VVFNIHDNKLGPQINGPFVQPNQDLPYAVGSPCPKRPFVAVTIGQPLYDDDGNVTNFVAGVYTYNVNDPTVPVGHFVFGSVDPTRFAFSIGGDLNVIDKPYLGVYFGGNFSYPDGKYLVYQFPAAPPNTTSGSAFTVATAVRTGILRVNKDGSLYPVVEITTSTGDADNPPLTSQLGIVMRRDLQDKNIYHLLASSATLVSGATTPTPNNYLETLKFNANKQTLKVTSMVPIPQTGLGYDFNYALDRVIVATRSVLKRISVAQDPVISVDQPTANVPQKYSELRLYAYDSTIKKRALTFLSAQDFDEIGPETVRFSHDDKYISYIASQATQHDPYVEGSPSTPASYIPFTFPGTLLVIQKFIKEKSAFRLESYRAASASAFGLDWSPDDNLIAAAGAPDFARKDVQLYEVEKNC
jgi:hypothetical protein